MQYFSHHSGDYEFLEHALTIISPILELLNNGRSDHSNWQANYQKTRSATKNARNSGYENLLSFVYAVR